MYVAVLIAVRDLVFVSTFYLNFVWQLET